MEKINIVLAQAHQSQLEHPNIQRELRDIQTFFNEAHLSFKEGTVNYVLIRGLYNHAERSMNMVGVFVNKTEQLLCGLETTLSYQVKNHPSARFVDVELQLPPNFVGEIKPNEGFIVHLNVQVEGLSGEQEVFEATELAGNVSDLKIAYVNE